MQIELPISKSIANRWLMLQALHGDGLMAVSDSIPDDVLILHRALTTLHNSTPHYTTLHLANCGTAMRFLTAYCAQREGQTVILDGVERMHHRPIGQLVDALRSIGAQIEYIGEEGFPPLRIKGCILDTDRIVTLNNPQSTQFVSALLLIGAKVQTNCTSPYITLTRELIEQYISCRSQGVLVSLQSNDCCAYDCERSVVENNVVDLDNLERDWSSAAFWYEYVALYGGEITLPGLSCDSLQGDKIVADIFAHLGVHTTYTPEGITITKNNDKEFLIQQPKQQNPTTIPLANTASGSGHNLYSEARQGVLVSLQSNDCCAYDCRAMLLTKNVVNVVDNNTLTIDFSACPDLYPAVALTCERLGIDLHATGIESLPLKESDRLRAVREHRTDHDHRMAMALLIAGYEVDDTDCIRKSYPQFIDELCKLR